MTALRRGNKGLFQQVLIDLGHAASINQCT
jgi:hypothetical protein